MPQVQPIPEFFALEKDEFQNLLDFLEAVSSGTYTSDEKKPAEETPEDAYDRAMRGI